MKNFILVGMVSPGRINLLGYGTLDLENISDKLAEELFLKGCRYLQPTSEYRKKLFPNEKAITVTPLNLTRPARSSSSNATPSNGMPTEKASRRRKL